MIMEELTVYRKVYDTTMEMMRDRGYSVPKRVLTTSEFTALYNNKQLDLCLNNNGNSKKCYVKFIHTNKIRPNILREYIQQIKGEYLPDQIIIVLKQKPNNTLLKIPSDPQFNFVQIFWMKHLMFNITKHTMVPKFEKLTEEESDALLKQMNIQNRFQLPIMLSTDPISKYYDYSNGDICRITRKSPGSCMAYSYRCVK